ncbi:hypothetical protein W97_03634 [Coniosporium apollinis CBS 100218]|uniref:F-box domain-containing protein n=1 Tax=Coniosporium apollinis (strain CBS 100218) TaxID=1168221 RepID=R7YRB5_CONA1|nr:uncharacterized protein W97_03634 [Coniosporium apollinis CBS 100218]EON64403.1 hypothetical protein W97_03634 [Coniosporium apollinis CBS 100218]
MLSKCVSSCILGLSAITRLLGTKSSHEKDFAYATKASEASGEAVCSLHLPISEQRPPGSATQSLLTLPTELLLIIASDLDPSALLSWKLSHPLFYHMLKLPADVTPAVLSICARLAVRDYLKSSDVQDNRMRCALCKGLYPPDMFSSATSPACIPFRDLNRRRQEVLDMPERVCIWDIGRLVRFEAATTAADEPQWTSSMESVCMHCGAVQSWNRCACQCQTCSVREARTYTRWLSCGEPPGGRFAFARHKDGSLWVREWGLKGGDRDDPSVEMCVHIE